MNIEVDVRELVLTGVEVPDPAALATAVTAALTRLLTDRGLPRSAPAPGPLRARPDADLPAALAEAIWAGLGRPGHPEPGR
ncbi:hypothetical protein [Micromonospora sp. L32]|uniref:hypothetical protein n=1 Tax=Micromonospora sp. L32 TaxID=3452214 RepID=UPI003F88BA92